MRRIKEIITVLAAVCVMCSCYPAIAYAASAELRFSDPSTTVGAEVEVTATFTASASVQSMDATLTYDSAMLRFVSGNHAQESGGTIQLSGAGDGMSQVLEFSMTFQALAEGTTKIEVSSSNGVDVYQSGIDIVNGSSTITIGPGDPSLIQPVVAPSGGSATVEVNGVSYTISNDFTDLVIPEGFERSELALDGAVYSAVKQTTSDTILAYLQPQEGDAEFFLYNPDNATFSVFEQVEIGTRRYLIFLDNTSGVKVPGDYLETKLNIADSGREFPAWQNTTAPEYYLVYGINSDGAKGLYLYDTVDGSYQRFLNTAKDSGKDDGPALGKLSNKLLGKLGNFADILIIAVIAFILLLLMILIVVAIKLRHRNLELDDLYDEYGIDLDDEPEEAAVPDKKSKKKGEKESKKSKKKKSEDDFYDFEDEDDLYDEEEYDEEDGYEDGELDEDDFKEYNASDYEDDSEIEDLDAMLNARVRVKKQAKRPNMASVGPEEPPRTKVGHAEDDDTFKMDLIDLD